MNIMKNPKAIALMTTTLLIGSLMWLITTKQINSSLEAGLKQERLRTEEILSEKLKLEKEFTKTKDQLLSYRDRNTQLDKLVKVTTSRLEVQEREYNRMKKENLSLSQIKKQRQELIALQSSLYNELQTMTASNASLQEKNNELSKLVSYLEERNKQLASDLNSAMFAAVDQSQIQALKGKREKLTVKATRTKKLVANFEVASNLKNLSFRVINPNGKVLRDNDGTFSLTTLPSEKTYTASTTSEGERSTLQNVQIIFIPKSRLKTGLYTVEILNENLYVGSLKVKLK